MNEKTVWESYTEEDKKKVYDFCEEYRTFLSKCKTERECVKEILKEAEAKGYRSLKEVRRSGEKLQAGDKLYIHHRSLAPQLFVNMIFCFFLKSRISRLSR